MLTPLAAFPAPHEEERSRPVKCDNGNPGVVCRGMEDVGRDIKRECHRPVHDGTREHDPHRIASTTKRPRVNHEQHFHKNVDDGNPQHEYAHRPRRLENGERLRRSRGIRPEDIRQDTRQKDEQEADDKRIAPADFESGERRTLGGRRLPRSDETPDEARRCDLEPHQRYVRHHVPVEHHGSRRRAHRTKSVEQEQQTLESEHVQEEFHAARKPATQEFLHDRDIQSEIARRAEALPVPFREVNRQEHDYGNKRPEKRAVRGSRHAKLRERTHAENEEVVRDNVHDHGGKRGLHHDFRLADSREEIRKRVSRKHQETAENQNLEVQLLRFHLFGNQVLHIEQRISERDCSKHERHAEQREIKRLDKNL